MKVINNEQLQEVSGGWGWGNLVDVFGSWNQGWGWNGGWGQSDSFGGWGNFWW